MSKGLLICPRTVPAVVGSQTRGSRPVTVFRQRLAQPRVAVDDQERSDHHPGAARTDRRRNRRQLGDRARSRPPGGGRAPSILCRHLREPSRSLAVAGAMPTHRTSSAPALSIRSSAAQPPRGRTRRARRGRRPSPPPPPPPPPGRGGGGGGGPPPGSRRSGSMR